MYIQETKVAVIEAYGHLCKHLLDEPAMENFLGFDLNKDGLISLAEAIMTTDKITTFDEFNEIDIDNNVFFVQKSLTPPSKSH